MIKLIKAWVGFPLGLVLFQGCSVTSSPKYAQLGLVEVSGRLTLEGQPLTDATIEFVNEADQTYSFGYLDENGYYSLMFDSRTPGIIPGEKSIRIREGKPAGMSEMLAGRIDEEDPDAKAVMRLDVPECYKQLGKIKVNVTGETSSMNLDLNRDCTGLKSEG